MGSWPLLEVGLCLSPLVFFQNLSQEPVLDHTLPVGNDGQMLLIHRVRLWCCWACPA